MLVICDESFGFLDFDGKYFKIIDLVLGERVVEDGIVDQVFIFALVVGNSEFFLFLSLELSVDLDLAKSS